MQILSHAIEKKYFNPGEDRSGLGELGSGSGESGSGLGESGSGVGNDLRKVNLSSHPLPSSPIKIGK